VIKITVLNFSNDYYTAQGLFRICVYTNKLKKKLRLNWGAKMKFIVNLLTCFSLLFLLGCETLKDEPQPPSSTPVADVRCWDGSIVHNSGQCPAEPVPVPEVLCWDGSIVYDQAACPPHSSQGQNGLVADPICIKNKTCTSVDVLFGTTRKIDWTIPPELDGNPASDLSAFSEQLKNDINI